MDTVSSFLLAHRERFDLDGHGIGDTVSSVVVTPRFRASAHVVVLVLRSDGTGPALVVKMPRLTSGHASVRREAAFLRALHAANARARRVAPQLVACEEYGGRPMLVETALNGHPLDRTAVRRDPPGACDAALAWLAAIGGPNAEAPEFDRRWYEHQIEHPLVAFADRFPFTRDEAAAVERTLELASPLARTELPVVFEHGDLSHPNIVMQDGGEIGVIDWETAEPHGLPLSDLFFFLAFVAAARTGASSADEHVRAFDDAFFGRRAWARPYVCAGARRLDIATESFTPLLLVSLLRRAATYAARVQGGVDAPLSHDQAQWLRATRYFRLWRHTAANVNRLVWGDLEHGLRLVA